jgi:hypothetical protein
MTSKFSLSHICTCCSLAYCNSSSIICYCNSLLNKIYN